MKEFFLTFFASQSAANFSSLIQAILSVGIALYGVLSFNKWVKEKSYEKRSDYADSSLTYMEDSHERFLELFAKTNASNWDDEFARAKSALGQARRKANRLGDDRLNNWFNQYDAIIKSIEMTHSQGHDDLFTSKEKAIADDHMAHWVKQLKTLYSNIYEDLLSQSLINYSR